MSTIAWIILGAVVASLLWMFVIAWLLDVIAAQRKALTNAQVTLRLYRETRTDSDRQIRELLSQNERLAIQLIEAHTTMTPAPTVQVPVSFFQPGAES